MKNKKGFTLIELLAVIVILAILLAVAIPRVTNYISGSRRDSLVTTAREFADTVEKDATKEIYELPISNNDITIVSLNLMNLQKGGSKSPFNAKWAYSNSYVAIVNVGTDIDPIYKYYVTLSDKKKYSLPLVESEKINSKQIVRNGDLTSITPICGSKEGEYKVMGKIKGLEELNPTGSWNATIYMDSSEEGC